MHRHIHFCRLALCASLSGLAALAGTAAAQSAASQSAEQSRPDAASPSVLAPFRAGDTFFNVSSAGDLFVRSGEQGAPRQLLPAGSFGVLAPSPNGRYIAYTLGPLHHGSYDIRVRDVRTGQDLPDVLHHSLLSPAAWSHDNKGFLFVRQDTTDGRERVYYHGLGRDPLKDVLIFSQFDHPDWRYAARVSDDGHYAVFTISYPADANTRIYFIDLADPGKPNFGAPVVKLSQTFDARHEFVDNAGSFFFLQTNRGAPRGRIVLANTDVIRENAWPSVVPETPDTLLFARTAGEQYLVAVYRTSAGGTVAHLYGPEDPSVVRKEIRDRIDSLQKARKKEGDRRAPERIGERSFRGNGPAIRLTQQSDMPLPAGGTIVAMNSLADQDELFYTVRLSDGALRSFSYNVTDGRTAPYPNGPTPSSPH